MEADALDEPMPTPLQSMATTMHQTPWTDIVRKTRTSCAMQQYWQRSMVVMQMQCWDRDVTLVVTTNCHKEWEGAGA